MLKTINDFEFVSIWNTDNKELKKQLFTFWLEHDLMLKEEAVKRVDQAVVIIKCNGKIVGVSTVFKTYFKKLAANVYAYRCFIEKAYRAPALSTRLTIETKRILATALSESDKPVGLLAVIQNQKIKQYWNKAVWPDVDLVYIGNAANGDHFRISYFENSKI
ncbi:MAG TPA: hypothetical protein PKL31_08860 [Fulvivirga sp.]|nr:hypothetical protein [Fulvivirga sp.]